MDIFADVKGSTHATANSKSQEFNPMSVRIVIHASYFSVVLLSSLLLLFLNKIKIVHASKSFTGYNIIISCRISLTRLPHPLSHYAKYQQQIFSNIAVIWQSYDSRNIIVWEFNQPIKLEILVNRTYWRLKRTILILLVILSHIKRNLRLVYTFVIKIEFCLNGSSYIWWSVVHYWKQK